MQTSKKLIRLAVSGALAASMLVPSSLAMYQAKVTADALYLRESPGGDIITTLSQDTIVAVLNNSSSWYKVAVNGREGYVSGEYVRGTQQTDFSLGTAKIVCSTSVNFRSQPNTSSSVLASLPNGASVSITGASNGWFKATYNGQSGYVSADYVSFTGGSSSSASSSTSQSASTTATATKSTGKIVCDTSVNFRSQPNTSCSVIGSLYNGATITILSSENGWYKATYNGKTGYISADYVTVTSGQASDSAVSKPSNSVSYNGTSAKRKAVIEYAAQFLGTPYVYGGSTPSGFDCSGFTSYVFANTVGSIPRVAQAQFDATTRVSMSELKPGDLVFFGSSASSISHVGIYVGDGKFIHSPHTGDVVKYDSLSGYYSNRFQGGGRVIFD